MAALVRQWEASSEPRQAFARRHGVTVGCFDYWKRRLREAGADAPRVTFAPVHVVGDSGPMPAAIELVLVSGERLSIPGGVSSAHVRAVLAALKAPC